MQSSFGWRSSFVALLAAGLAVAALVWLFLAETLAVGWPER